MEDWAKMATDSGVSNLKELRRLTYEYEGWRAACPPRRGDDAHANGRDSGIGGAHGRFPREHFTDAST